jgi:hypothetical protein
MHSSLAEVQLEEANREVRRWRWSFATTILIIAAASARAHYVQGIYACNPPERMAESHAREIERSLDMHRLRHGGYPTTAEGLTHLDFNTIDLWGKRYGYVISGLRNSGNSTSSVPDKTEYFSRMMIEEIGKDSREDRPVF